MALSHRERSLLPVAGWIKTGVHNKFQKIQDKREKKRKLFHRRMQTLSKRILLHIKSWADELGVDETSNLGRPAVISKGGDPLFPTKLTKRPGRH